jgi:hypothetical protein
MDKLSIILVIIYTLLYISHIILGPYYYRFLVKGESPKFISKSIGDVLKKSVYITYISMLFTIYFFTNPNTETYMCGLLITVLSLVFYIIKYRDSEYFKESMIDHSILMLLYIFYKFYYDIQIKLYKPTTVSYFTLILLIIYFFIQDLIY